MASPPAGTGNANPAFAVATAVAGRMYDAARSQFAAATCEDGILSRAARACARVVQRRKPRLRRRRRPRTALPIVLRHGNVQHPVRVILEDIVEYVIAQLHDIQKSLVFWQSRSEGTQPQKIYFFIFERGPRAFIEGTYQLVSKILSNDSPAQYISHSASDMISVNIAVLTYLQCCLATFLAEAYDKVDKEEKIFSEDLTEALSSMHSVLNDIFSKLEASLTHPPDVYKDEDLLFSHDGSSYELAFEKLPELASYEWTDINLVDSNRLIQQNLQRLDSYLSYALTRHKKPSRMTLYWFRYTCGAVGLSICSGWILSHSSVLGSPDIENWIQETKDSMTGFWTEHVEKPLISIRDELFETFKRREKGVMEVEEVQLTANSLRRMLIAFCEQTKGQKMPEGMSEQEMMEIVMARYEKEVMHPLQNLVNGELARAMLIQIQKLKWDLETAMLELDQILRANEINFAILAALPAFILSLLTLMLIRAWVLHDKGAEGRGRVARRQRRLLLVEIEKRLMEFQSCMEQEKVEEAQCKFGLVIYSLDRLSRAVEQHAKETEEWLSVREDIIDVARCNMDINHKLAVVTRLSRMYDCLLPSRVK